MNVSDDGGAGRFLSGDLGAAGTFCSVVVDIAAALCGLTARSGWFDAVETVAVGVIEALVDTCCPPAQSTD